MFFRRGLFPQMYEFASDVAVHGYLIVINADIVEIMALRIDCEKSFRIVYSRCEAGDLPRIIRNEVAMAQDAPYTLEWKHEGGLRDQGRD